MGTAAIDAEVLAKGGRLLRPIEMKVVSGALRRSRLEIYLEVLKVIKKGTHKPTRIMYQTNLSWKPLMEVLSTLNNQNLITTKKQGKHSLYSITEKGNSILNQFHKALELVEIK